MKAVVLEAPGRFACIEREVPAAGPGEALVRIHRAGICASDLATIRGDNPIAVYPLTLGHESIGVVESAPAGAGVAAGDWVTVYPSVGCGDCPACRAGRINHCPTFTVLGISRDGGLFSERVAVGAGQLLPLPPALHGERGALVEPAAVAVHVNRRGATRAGERVLIVGAGVIGILTAQVARAYGAGGIVLIDRLASRRAVLEQLGFEQFLHADGAALHEKVLAAAGPLDVVYDTVCNEATLALGAAVLSPGGRLVLVAVPHGTAPLGIPFAQIYRRELALIASRNYVPDDFREAIRLLETGAIATAPMITATYPLAEFATAHAALTRHPERHLKVLLRP
jgi:2-desacetyl-2-hydroxyethyl bacteriochlorophyllide A dehydrogenase